jgi:hypothetical protein
MNTYQARRILSQQTLVLKSKPQYDYFSCTIVKHNIVYLNAHVNYMYFLQMMSYYNNGYTDLKHFCTMTRLSIDHGDHPLLFLFFLNKKTNRTDWCVIPDESSFCYDALLKPPVICICSHPDCDPWAYPRLACGPNIIPERSNGWAPTCINQQIGSLKDSLNSFGRVDQILTLIFLRETN